MTFPSFRRIHEDPVLLTLGLAAVRFLLFPYAGLVHDAQLYSFQILNRVTGGRFSEDLFFAYGSQDSYSLFSPLAAILAQYLTLRTACFVIYLAGALLQTYAWVRLSGLITGDPLVRVASAVLLALSPIPYSAWEVFIVNETFMTPRIAATALSVLAIVAAVEKRPRATLLLSAAGIAIHPLMAFGGLILVAGLHIAHAIRSRGAFLGFSRSAALTALSTAAGLVPFFWLPRAQTAWLETSRLISPHCFPSAWPPSDWVMLGLILAVATLAGILLPGTIGILSGLSAALGFSALAATVFMEATGNVILMKGQPYRAVWLTSVLAIPASLMLARILHSQGRLVPAALCVAWALGTLSPTAFSGTGKFRLVAIAAAVMMALLPLLLRFPYPVGLGAWTALAIISVCAAQLTLGLLFLVIYLVNYSELVSDWTPGLLWYAGWSAMGRVHAYAVGLLAVVAAGRLTPRGKYFAAALPAATALAWYMWSNSESFRLRFEKGWSDVAFVRRFVGQRAAAGRTPVIYWPLRATYSWVDVQANAYFQWPQIQGALFNPGTAAEGGRRLGFVQPFEYHTIQQETSGLNLDRALRLFSRHRTASVPTDRDLHRLCSDPILDFVFIEDHLQQPPAARHNKLNAYDCHDLRSLRQ
jgi:hypothetical protein